jgi:hypothetical protein
MPIKAYGLSGVLYKTANYLCGTLVPAAYRRSKDCVVGRAIEHRENRGERPKATACTVRSCPAVLRVTPVQHGLRLLNVEGLWLPGPSFPPPHRKREAACGGANPSRGRAADFNHRSPPTQLNMQAVSSRCGAVPFRM